MRGLNFEIVTPDQGIGTGLLAGKVSHPDKDKADFEKDIRELFPKAQEESDDQIFTELEKQGYTFEFEKKVFHIDLSED